MILPMNKGSREYFPFLCFPPEDLELPALYQYGSCLYEYYEFGDTSIWRSTHGVEHLAFFSVT